VAADPGGRPEFSRFLNVRSAYGPSFDGRGTLSFLSDLTGLPQVWALGAAGRWPEQLTYGLERVTQASAQPGGRWRVVASDRGGDERHQLALLVGPGDSRPLTADPEVIHTVGVWSPDGRAIAFASNRRHAAFFDVYLQGLPAGEPTLVFAADGVHEPVAWSPDGAYLVVERRNTPSDQELLLVRLDGSEPVRTVSPPGAARYHSVAFEPSGRALLLATDHERDFLGTARLDLATGALRFLEEPTWDVEYQALRPDGRLLARAINVDGDSRLEVLDLATGDRAPVDGLPPGAVADPRWGSALCWSQDGRRLAVGWTTPQDPPDVWVYDAATRAVERWTASGRAGLERDALAPAETVRYPTFDGREVPAFFYRPRGARPDGTLPVVVNVHGGPESQARPIWNPVNQYLVSRGFGVLAPNVRGSTGYGNAYAHLDDVRRRMDAVRDLRAAAEWLVASGWAHPRRIGVLGGSYGGFMVLAALTTDPEVWAAGVDLVGIANFVTFLEQTSPWRRPLREAEYGSLAADRAFLEEISPIHRVDRIVAPLFVVHGANDPRVPIGEAEQIVAALRARSRPVEYLRFDDEGHGLVRLANKLVAYPRIAAFLERWLLA
jgi:dipeptidyl aminopeptidase/acylaminoacyl peptidase